MKKQDERGIELHLIHGHAPKDKQFVSALAEGVKYQGVEVVGQTVKERDYALSPDTAAVLEERFQHYLRKLESPEPMEMESRVFLSYAREDYEDVCRFHHELLRAGMFTWLDKSILMGIRIGENWVERTFEMLSSCFAMAYCLSPHSIQSAVVGYEVDFFLERMKIRSGACFAIVLLQKMDVEYFKQLGVPVVEFYRLPAKDAAEQLLNEMVAFYRKARLSKESINGTVSSQPIRNDSGGE